MAGGRTGIPRTGWSSRSPHRRTGRRPIANQKNRRCDARGCGQRI